jgi:peptidoglycan hydrolase-like protein with peptidoglycan-binding domain
MRRLIVAMASSMTLFMPASADVARVFGTDVVLKGPAMRIGSGMTVARGDVDAQHLQIVQHWRRAAESERPSAGTTGTAPRPAQTAQSAPRVIAVAPRLSGRRLITEIQRKLAALGYDPGPADGLMGWKTRAAIRSYQSQKGVGVTGEASQALLDHLYARASDDDGAAPSAPASTASAVPTGAAMIREIQQSLAALGYEPGAADGKIAWKTRSAIRSYQSQAGLSVDGEASKGLLEHLRGALARRRGTTKTAAAARPRTPAPAPVPARSGAASGRQAREMASELARLVEKGERRGLTDPGFLDELRRLVHRYDRATVSRPARRRYLGDDFSDGDFTRQPGWSVAAGSFSVSQQGELTSAVQPVEGSGTQRGRTGSKGLASEVLARVLSEASSGRRSTQASGAAEAATIFLSGRVENAFSIRATLSLRPESICELGVFSGPRPEYGYRLAIVSGDRLTLYRYDRDGANSIQSSRRRLSPGDDNMHEVVWSRDQAGKMTIRLDDEAMLSADDRAFNKAFDGVEHNNRMGECRLQSISVEEAQ